MKKYLVSLSFFLLSSPFVLSMEDNEQLEDNNDTKIQNHCISANGFLFETTVKLNKHGIPSLKILSVKENKESGDENYLEEENYITLADGHQFYILGGLSDHKSEHNKTEKFFPIFKDIGLDGTIIDSNDDNFFIHTIKKRI